MLENVIHYREELLVAIEETFIMVIVSGFFAVIIGSILGIILSVTKKDGILEKKIVYIVLDKIINTLRSIPFVILLTIIIPITRFIVGTTIGIKGAIVPLVIGSVPFIARQIEIALSNIDQGVIEAAYAMGTSSYEIIYKVLLREALPEIVYSLVLAIISLINYSAIAGTVGGGGLGDFAIRYGYQQFKSDVMIVIIIILSVVTSIIQYFGEKFVRKLKH